MDQKHMESSNPRENFWKAADYRLNGEDDDSNGRKAWFAKIIATYKPKNILELGCNEGSNLRRIHKQDPSIKISAIEINEEAAKVAQASLPDARIVVGSIYEADKYFKEKEFDLVFSMGVVIHLPPDKLETVKRQALRHAQNTIIHCEEQSDTPRPMRFEENGLAHRWTHDYAKLYKEFNPNVFMNVVGSADGAHHLVLVNLHGNRLSQLKRARLWYLCNVLPFVDFWKVRFTVRWKSRGALRFFLPNRFWKRA